MDGFTSALQHLDIEYSLEEEVKLDSDMKEYKGVTYRWYFYMVRKEEQH